MNSQAKFVWDALEFRMPTIFRIVEPLSEDQLRWWPPNESNSIACLIWHIAEVEDNWIRDRLYGLPRQYPFGKYLTEVRALTRQRLEEMTVEVFDRIIHDEHWGTISVRQLWGGIITSCAWHGGQIALTNRLIPRDLKGTA